MHCTSEICSRESEICAICTDEIPAGASVGGCSGRTPDDSLVHIFHTSCIDRWTELSKNTCPTCRSPLNLRTVTPGTPTSETAIASATASPASPTSETPIASPAASPASPIREAARLGDFQAVSDLLDGGVAPSELGTALILATQEGQLETVALLLTERPPAADIQLAMSIADGAGNADLLEALTRGYLVA